MHRRSYRSPAPVSGLAFQQICRNTNESAGTVELCVIARPDTDFQLSDATWIAGCDRCRSHLIDLCAKEDFTPNIAYSSDDMVVMQSLVAAGLGVTTIPGLALRAHRSKGITATELTGADRHVFAATYGEPPDPPATAALLAALALAASAK